MDNSFFYKICSFHRAYKAGTTGGSSSHTLTVSEMPKHHHSIKVKGTTGDWETVVNANATGAAPTFSDVVCSDVGGSQPFSVIPPYAAYNLWIRTA